MSRAININVDEAHVLATCAKLGIGISTIETLRSGGTRVILNNSPDTATITKAYGSKVLTGPVQRLPTRLSHW
jgi:hypothetical protein